MAVRHNIGQGAAITADVNLDFEVPSGASHAVFYLDLSAVAGTTPIMDVKLQYLLPGGGVQDVSGGVFAQLVAAGVATLQVGPGIVEEATGNDRRAAVLLGQRMRAVVDIDRTTGNETYTYRLDADFS